eukprot:Nitzschia sp. Nitz4//scaffold442_size7113//1169//1858//NITZ4_009162-RA/size7113-processed-gene-0.0-mRNA-1//1//CDS//3329552029//6444//frame0
MSFEVLDVQVSCMSLVSSPGDVVRQGCAEEDNRIALEDPAASEEVMAATSEEHDSPVLATAVVLGTSNVGKVECSPLLKATKAGLDSRNITYDVSAPNDDEVIAVTFKANLVFARGVPFKILIKESSELFILLLNLPTLVPEEHRTLVSKYWTRVNYSLNVGNFEMDFRDGEVRFRVAAGVKNTALSPEMVGDAVDTAAGTVRRFLPGQFYVIYGDMDVEKAYQTSRND